MKRGAWIAILVVVAVLLGLVIIAGLIYMQLTEEPYIPDQTYLKIILAGDLVDHATATFPKFAAQPLSIRDLWFHLQRAKIDPRIRGIVLKISGLRCGFAKVEEVGRLIEDFRLSHKPVMAMLEDGGLREYYLSTFATRTYCFRGGFLLIHGIWSEALFLKNTLAKLGIKTQFFQVGDYKTAPNMYTQDRLTNFHREALTKLLADIYQAVIDGIARNRGLAVEKVRQILNDSPLTNEEYLEARFFDGILYEDQVVKELKPEYPLTEFSTYRKTTSPRPFSGSKQIAVIFASGEIYPGSSEGKSPFGDSILGSDTLGEQLRTARKSSSVKAVVLRIDSPGGYAPASEAIFREAQLLAEKKPLVISMSDLAASGGYWIALSSNRILAHPETVTGSIGVFGGKFILKDLYSKLGINKELIETTPSAGMFSDYREFTPSEQNKIMAEMKKIYGEFLKKVSQNRKIPVAEVDGLGRGRVWSGRSALELKLIDQFGGLTDAIREARKLAKIPESEKTGIKIYPREKSVWDVLMTILDVRVENPMDIEARIRQLKNYYLAYRLPFNLVFN